MLSLDFVMFFPIYITHYTNKNWTWYLGMNPNPTSKNDVSILMLYYINCKLIKVANVRKHIVKTAVST